MSEIRNWFKLKLNDTNAATVFDYHILRFIIGAIAFILPVVVLFVADESLTSISASYYTDARNYFVGLLFVISALLLSYNGHIYKEKVASKFASLAAVGVALYPTLCDVIAEKKECIDCSGMETAIIHYGSAALMFGVLAYFCLGPFRERKNKKGKEFDRRRRVYLACGWIIILSFVIGFSIMQVFQPTLEEDHQILLVVEWVALWAFGYAWMVSGNVIPYYANSKERIHIF